MFDVLISKNYMGKIPFVDECLEGGAKLPPKLMPQSHGYEINDLSC